MYWDHRFHHRWNKYVVPVTANAVSLAEYVIAYMLPFIAGAALVADVTLDDAAATLDVAAVTLVAGVTLDAAALEDAAAAALDAGGWS